MTTWYVLRGNISHVITAKSVKPSSLRLSEVFRTHATEIQYLAVLMLRIPSMITMAVPLPTPHCTRPKIIVWGYIPSPWIMRFGRWENLGDRRKDARSLSRLISEELPKHERDMWKKKQRLVCPRQMNVGNNVRRARIASVCATANKEGKGKEDTDNGSSSGSAAGCAVDWRTSC